MGEMLKGKIMLTHRDPGKQNRAFRLIEQSKI